MCTSTTLCTGKTYQIAEGEVSQILASKYEARWSGEIRPVKKGEWYLSGAIIEAYYAKNGTNSPYPIAEIKLRKCC